MSNFRIGDKPPEWEIRRLHCQPWHNTLDPSRNRMGLLPVRILRDRANRMMDKQFLANFKRATEAKWATQSMNPSIFGFQFQPGARWMFPSILPAAIIHAAASIGSGREKHRF